MRDKDAKKRSWSTPEERRKKASRRAVATQDCDADRMTAFHTQPLIDKLRVGVCSSVSLLSLMGTAWTAATQLLLSACFHRCWPCLLRVNCCLGLCVFMHAFFALLIRHRVFRRCAQKWQRRLHAHLLPPKDVVALLGRPLDSKEPPGLHVEVRDAATAERQQPFSFFSL